MAPTKTAGGQEPSDKFLKRDAAAKGLGADSAPAHKDGHAPGEAPVASDSGKPIREHPAEEEAVGLGSVPGGLEHSAVGTEGIRPARPGGAAKGPNLAGPA